MGFHIDRLKRDKYIEIYLRKIRNNSKKGFPDTKNQRFLIYFHPDKKDPHLIDSGEDFLLLSKWLSFISVPGRIVTFSTKTGLLGRWKRDLAI
jgi:hypothetical protein